MEKQVLWTICPWKTLLVIFDIVEKPGCRMADLFCCTSAFSPSAAQLQLHCCCPERLNCLVMTRLRGQVGRWNCVLDKRAALSHVHACPDPQFKTPLSAPIARLRFFWTSCNELLAPLAAAKRKSTFMFLVKCAISVGHWGNDLANLRKISQIIGKIQDILSCKNFM